MFQTPKSSGQADIEWLKYSRWCAKKCIPPIMIDLYHLIERRLQKSRQCLHQSGLPLLKRTLLDELFPGSKNYTVAVSMQHLYADIGSLPLAELTILGAISRYMNPRSVFEIGTYRGLSTLAIAMNTPDDTELFTLDLDKQNRNVTKYPMEMGGIEASSFPVGEYYHGSVHERKIQQLYGDSANFDFAPFTGSIDLIFIDGNHLYENVKTDSFNAFRMLRSKGVIIWDDYHAGYPGVMKCLDELAESKPLVRIAKTRLVVYRSDR